MAKFVCKVCGYIYEGEAAPAECPVCHAKSDMFQKVEGELVLAAEHEYGIYAKTVKDNKDISDEDKKFIFDQLKANFNGECSIVETGVAVTTINIPHPVNKDTIVSEIVLPSFERMNEVATIKVAA